MWMLPNHPAALQAADRCLLHEHHALGGYETWRARSSYLEVAASEKVTATLRELLATVAK